MLSSPPKRELGKSAASLGCSACVSPAACYAGEGSRATRNSAWSGWERLGHGSICPAVIEQRIASAHDYFFDLCNKNRVITGILRAMQPALKIGQSAVQDRSAMGGAIEVRPRLPLSMTMVLSRARIVLGNDALVLRQHVHSKPLLGMQVSMRPGTMVHANQHQRRIERHGA